MEDGIDVTVQCLHRLVQLHLNGGVCSFLEVDAVVENHDVIGIILVKLAPCSLKSGDLVVTESSLTLKEALFISTGLNKTQSEQLSLICALECIVQFLDNTFAPSARPCVTQELDELEGLIL